MDTGTHSHAHTTAPATGAVPHTATRTVTTLFTDLVGSTDLPARIGASAAERLRCAHFEQMRNALALHRGREVKTLGDGFMAVFASSSGALACAVAMQQAVAEHNRRAGAPVLALRAGLSTGEAREEGGDYYGLSVIQAARLCAAAGPGQILAADILRLLAGEWAQQRLEPVGAMTLKGLPAPTVAWEVVWDAARDVALRVAIAGGAALEREGLARVLEAQSIDVVAEAAGAGAVIAGLAASRPHVVLLARAVARSRAADGRTVAEWLRDAHPGIGVVVLDRRADGSRLVASIRRAAGDAGSVV